MTANDRCSPPVMARMWHVACSADPGGSWPTASLPARTVGREDRWSTSGPQTLNFGLSTGVRPLRPEAKLLRGLPVRQDAWHASDRPRVSADVHCCRWRLSLTSSLGRSRTGREQLLPHTLSMSAEATRRATAAHLAITGPVRQSQSV